MYGYFQYVFTTPTTIVSNKTVHDQLLAHLPSLLNPDNTDFLLINKFLVNSNFFFQIVIKSMGQYLLTTNRIKVIKILLIIIIYLFILLFELNCIYYYQLWLYIYEGWRWYLIGEPSRFIFPYIYYKYNII